LFSIWGGVVRYLIDVKSGVISEKLKSIFYQVIISSFTGVVSGLISAGVGANFHLVFAISGIASAMGNKALNYYWDRITGRNNGAL
jgi:hypothetical protein